MTTQPVKPITEETDDALANGIPSATERPQETGHPTTLSKDTVALGGIANQSDWAGPFYHDVTDAAYNARINWSQAVNLAVEAVASRTEVFLMVAGGYFEQVEELANRFYPLIRKGPTEQEPDALEQAHALVNDPRRVPHWDTPGNALVDPATLPIEGA